MLIDLKEVIVKDNRIRKDYGNIDTLADNIKKLGQLQPIVVDQDYTLIAGERRYKAIKKLGLEKIDVKIIKFDDYLHMLEVEIAENEERKEFTVSERVEYARKVEELEKLKAKERQASSTGGSDPQLRENFPEAETGRVRDKVAEKTGFGSGKQFEKAKFVVDNAVPEVIKEMDKGNISIHKAYNTAKGAPDKDKSDVDNSAEQMSFDTPVATEDRPEIESTVVNYDKFVLILAENIQNLILPFRENMCGIFPYFRFNKYLDISKLTNNQQLNMVSILDISFSAENIIDDVIKCVKLNVNKDVIDVFIKAMHEISAYEMFIQKDMNYFEFHNELIKKLTTVIKKDDQDSESIIGCINGMKTEIEAYIKTGKAKARETSNNKLPSNTSYQKILGVPDDVSKDEAKKKYQKLMKILHPDLGGSGYLLQLVKDAYESIEN